MNSPSHTVKKKVLIIGTPSEDGGGVAKYIKSLKNSTNKNESVTIHTLKNITSESFNQQYTLFSILIKALKFKQLTKKLKYDVVHAHTQKTALLVALSKTCAANFKMVYTPHGLRHTQLSGFKKFFHYLIDLYIFYVSNKIIAISNSEYKKMITMTKLKSKIIHIKTKILTTKPIDDHSDYFFKKYNKENKKIILMIGEIYACKNPQLFIDIYNKTKKENNNLFFIWIGDGKNLVQWKKFIKTKSYQNILFPGSLPHKTTMGILSKAQLLLATSVTEAFPLYILEAFMLKTPVLCNSYPTVSDIIENQKNAITFKFNDAQDASEKLLELVSDQSLQNKLTINAKNFFLENHANIKDFSEEHVKVYQEVSS